MPNPVRWFLDRYMNHVANKVNGRAERVRQLQAESGMNKERIVRYEIYEADMTRRDVHQTVHPFTVRVSRDGTFEILSFDARPDVTVYTDFPTVWGIAKGRYVQKIQSRTGGNGGGDTRVIEPFTVFDAVRLGRVEWAGTSSTLAELMLFEKKIAPEFLKMLRM